MLISKTMMKIKMIIIYKHQGQANVDYLKRSFKYPATLN